MDTPLTRGEHAEFRRTLDAEISGLKAEDARQNDRIEQLEDTVLQINSLTVSVEKLAVSMDGMLRELTEQSERMKKLEGRDGENWKKIVSGLITGIVGGLVVFVMAKLGLG